MSTSVSVMRSGNTMRRFLREHFFRTSTSRYVTGHVSFILLRIHHVYVVKMGRLLAKTQNVNLESSPLFTCKISRSGNSLNKSY